ncbi:peptidoglycan-binding protein [Streptomyces sp. NPDC057686]|uniref:peptidoglycan-binding protein n=1 Tax=Streptomyces sp. NPDC057686 TaxID=3346212 RepID=UPI003676C56B
MSGVEAMIAQAEKSIGLGEPNYIQAWYNDKFQDLGTNWAWCDASISYWAWMSGNQLAVVFGGAYVYTVSHAEKFKNQGQWHTDVAGIRRGDIVFFDWEGSDSIAAIDHVGIVTSVSGRYVYTIEGNTSNQCLRRVRTADVIAGYGRPEYVETATPPASPPPATAAKYTPFPGRDFFVAGRKSPVIGRMHARLMAVGCNRYRTQTKKDVWGSGDVASYAAWQRRMGFSGDDADGIPGKTSWDALRVPTD